MGKESDLIKAIKKNDMEKIEKIVCPGKANLFKKWNMDEKRENIRLHKMKKISHINLDCHEEVTGYTPLILAVLQANIELVAIFILYGAEINAKDYKKNTALHMATFVGRSDILEILIEAGAELNEENDDGNSSLHLASQNYTTGNKFVLVKLLRADAITNLPNKNGSTPIDLAAQYDRKEAVSILLDHNPSLHNSNKAIIEAAVRGYKDIVELLLDYGMNPNEIESQSKTGPLHEACRFSRFEVAEILIKYGADPDFPNGKNETARKILEIYPPEKSKPYFKLFEDWQGIPKLRPKYVEPADLEILYPQNILGTDKKLIQDVTFSEEGLINKLSEFPLIILNSLPEFKINTGDCNLLHGFDSLLPFTPSNGLKSIAQPVTSSEFNQLNISESQTNSCIYPLIDNSKSWTKNHPLYCSARTSQHPSTNILDDNPCTFWIIPSVINSWIVFDFGRRFILTGIRIFGWNSPTMINECELQMAESIRGPWKIVLPFSCILKGNFDIREPAESQDFHGFYQTSQYFRLFIYTNHGGAFTSFHGVKLFGLDEEVPRLFEEIQLEKYANVFINKGYNTLDKMFELTENDIGEIFKKTSNQKKVIKAICGKKKMCLSKKLEWCDCPVKNIGVGTILPDFSVKAETTLGSVELIVKKVKGGIVDTRFSNIVPLTSQGLGKPAIAIFKDVIIDTACDCSLVARIVNFHEVCTEPFLIHVGLETIGSNLDHVMAEMIKLMNDL